MQQVAPFAGAWIETSVYFFPLTGVNPSLPSRERGLKHLLSHPVGNTAKVAPFAGAWIETFTYLYILINMTVAPFAGAWIETGYQRANRPQCMSLPSRERGLKLRQRTVVKRRLESLPSRERGLKRIVQ